ncbi:hypothetical protein [Sorangium sp. So ce233]|uniref:hypothetical protein n=1 Tax=Sorangium sp. So ce233 TaxID=3133290 RepID=UPI003F607AC9
MLNRFMATALIAVMAFSACSVPDEGSLEGLLNKIRSMDPGSGKAARLEEARWRALEALRNGDPDDVVGDVRCHDGRGHSMIERIVARTIIDCLANTEHLTFALCVEARVDDITHNYTTADPTRNPGAWCEYVPNKSFQMDDKWDPDQITEEDLARSALASPSAPPAWMIAAGVVAIGAGGVFIFASGWGLVLCPLDIDYGCPGDPIAPGVTPEPGGSSGGDR